MATSHLRAESVSANITIEDVQQVARALRRLNLIDSAPVLTADDRAEIAEGKRVCWFVVSKATEALVSLMDAIAGDPDMENATEAEDAFEDHEERVGYSGPGCDVGDPGEDNTDREAIDEREPDHDAEVETWSHWMDHPPELHIGKRPGWNA